MQFNQLAKNIVTVTRVIDGIKTCFVYDMTELTMDKMVDTASMFTDEQKDLPLLVAQQEVYLREIYALVQDPDAPEGSTVETRDDFVDSQGKPIVINRAFLMGLNQKMISIMDGALAEAMNPTAQLG